MQSLMNLPPLETYLIAVPSVMLGAILLETWHRNGGDGARFR